MKVVMGFFICLVGIILPWRLRIVYAEGLGWVAQMMHFLYFSFLKFLVKNISRKKENDGV